jgi:hypothetical protein
MADDDEYRRKKVKRADDGFKKTSGVNYALTTDRHVDEARYERIKAAPAAAAGAATSATMDTINRLAAGQEGRSIKDKLADSNRPTWEQYKVANADKLDLTGVDEKKMKEYRDQLDRERDNFLSRDVRNKDGKDGKKSKKEKKEKKSKKHKKHKKDKKHKKSKKRSRDDSSDDDSSASDSESSSESSEEKKEKKSKKNKKSSKSENKDDAYRLSSFFTKGSDEDSD